MFFTRKVNLAKNIGVGMFVKFCHDFKIFKSFNNCALTLEFELDSGKNILVHIYIILIPKKNTTVTNHR